MILIYESASKVTVIAIYLGNPGRKMTEWPSKRGPIPKIMPSDGCKGDTVPSVVRLWYNFHECGCHLGNVGLQQNIAHLLKRHVDRPPKEVRRYRASFRYRVQSLTWSRRVVAKVEWHPDELYPR